jgi:hypothetical protein
MQKKIKSRLPLPVLHKEPVHLSGADLWKQTYPNPKFNQQLSLALRKKFKKHTCVSKVPVKAKKILMIFLNYQKN